MISQDIINQIIEKVNIAEVISEYIQVLPDGTGFKSVCPFHNDTNPSMKISPNKKIFKCFSCGAGGNVIQFVSRFEKIGFTEAVAKLAKRIGIEIQTNNDPNYETKKRFYQILNESNNFFNFYLYNSDEGKIALKYLEKRGITKEIIDHFKIGLAPKENDYLHKALEQASFNVIDQIESGMVRKGQDGSIIDSFRTRIMFPIYDINDRVVGFSGRTYLENDKSPKYINSNENLIFHKSEVLYNYSNAKEQARKEDTVFVFEGFMDVIAAYKAGVTNAVATMGTALTKQHLKSLHALASRIVLCFDGDNAGINATYKAAGIFATVNAIPYAVSLPDGMDPDEYQIKYGSEALRKYLLEQQQNVYEYIYNVAKKDLIKEDVVSVERFKEKVFSFLKFANSTIKEFYLNKLCNDLGVDQANLVYDLGAVVERQEVQEKVIEKPAKVYKKRIPKKIFLALEIIIKHCLSSKEEFTTYFCDHHGSLSVVDFIDYYEIFNHLAEQYAFSDVIDIEKLKNSFFENSSEQILLDKIIDNKMVALDDISEFEQCIKVLKDYSVREHRNAKLLGALEKDEMIDEYLNVLKASITIQ